MTKENTKSNEEKSLDLSFGNASSLTWNKIEMAVLSSSTRFSLFSFLKYNFVNIGISRQRKMVISCVSFFVSRWLLLHQFFFIGMKICRCIFLTCWVDFTVNKMFSLLRKTQTFLQNSFFFAFLVSPASCKLQLPLQVEIAVPSARCGPTFMFSIIFFA